MLLIEEDLGKMDWAKVQRCQWGSSQQECCWFDSDTLTILCGGLHVRLAPSHLGFSPGILTDVRHAHGVHVGVIVSVDDCLFLAVLILMNWQHRVNKLAVA